MPASLPTCVVCGRGSTRFVQTSNGTFLLCSDCKPPTPTIVVVDRGADAVYVGRAGQGEDGYFGNPYRVGERCDRCRTLHATAYATLSCFALYFKERLDSDGLFRQRVMALVGRKLWCPGRCLVRGSACHASIIADWVNAEVAAPVRRAFLFALRRMALAKTETFDEFRALRNSVQAPRFKLPPLPARRFNLPALPPRKRIVVAPQPRPTAKNTVTCVVDYTYAENESGNEQECVVVECSECEHVEQSWGHGDKSVRRCLVLMGQHCPEGDENFYILERHE